MVELLRHNVYQIIRQAILNCEFKPGQELREQVLAEMYRVSRSPVRDSLLRLEQENLVTVLPRQGYRVNPVVISDVDDLFGVRMIIEPACAAQAARCNEAARQTLIRFRAFAGDHTVWQIFCDHNKAFHSAVAELSGNRRMTMLACSLVEEADRLVRTGTKVADDMTIATLVQEHDRIIDAIQAQDQEAAYRFAREHVVNTHERLRAALSAAEQPPSVA